jgi:DNA modification methylase
MGLEGTPEAYTEGMADLFGAVMRALKPDGTLWLNLGDTYASQRVGLKHKDLVGIPWRTAFALQAAGWYLRSDIIWHKPNPMPESVTDRPTKAHEYIFLMSKSEKYYYDHEAIKEDCIEDLSKRKTPAKFGGANKHKGYDTRLHSGREYSGTKDGKKNKRTVWTVSLKSYPGAHFAVFPPELIEPCILAGTKEGDVVLDPFNGSGTVAHVCKKHKRRYIGIELSKEYLELNPDRIGAQGVLI